MIERKPDSSYRLFVTIGSFLSIIINVEKKIKLVLGIKK